MIELSCWKSSANIEADFLSRAHCEVKVTFDDDLGDMFLGIPVDDNWNQSEPDNQDVAGLLSKKSMDERDK